MGKQISKTFLFVFSGGGSGGHVYPAISILEAIENYFLKNKDFLKHSFQFAYIGSKKSIEYQLLSARKIPFFSIDTTKLYHKNIFKNIKGIILFLLGFAQSIRILLKLKKNINQFCLIGTGGYVSLAPVVAARIVGFKVFIHEQTSVAGLSNKIASYFAHIIFVSFKQSLKYFPLHKVIHSGYPLRKNILNQNLNFKLGKTDSKNIKKPCILIAGGANGSIVLNKIVDQYIDQLSKKYTLLHQTGESFIKKYTKKYTHYQNYYPFSLSNELPQMLKFVNCIITRAGAGIVSEIIALNQKAIFIPLPFARYNEQEKNALEAIKVTNSILLKEDQLDQTDLLKYIDILCNKNNKHNKSQNMQNNATDLIITEVLKLIH